MFYIFERKSLFLVSMQLTSENLSKKFFSMIDDEFTWYFISKSVVLQVLYRSLQQVWLALTLVKYHLCGIEPKSTFWQIIKLMCLFL